MNVVSDETHGISKVRGFKNRMLCKKMKKQNFSKLWVRISIFMLFHSMEKMNTRISGKVWENANIQKSFDSWVKQKSI